MFLMDLWPGYRMYIKETGQTCRKYKENQSLIRSDYFGALCEQKWIFYTGETKGYS